MARKGKWVYLPLDKWETLPSSYYSLRKSQIYLKLFLRNVPYGLIRWCLVYDVLPPDELRGRKLRSWIRSEAARRAQVAI